MWFKPIKQFNAILTQEYFEPTLSWAFRVVLALNVPLIVLPLLNGFSFEIIWAAFGAYLISLTDYRGLHYKKIIIQGLQAVLIFLSGMLGMLVSHSLVLSLLAMFFVGMFAALVRNWSDYGSSIGVSTGFFFLFGLSNPQPFSEALLSGAYLLLGAGWAIFITVFSFPFRPSNPVKRSVAKIWKTNTELLDTIIEQVSRKKTDTAEITKKEIEVRIAIDQSMDLFARRKKNTGLKMEHYDILIELRRASALFSAAIGALHEEMEALHRLQVSDSILYKTLSAFAQASARLSIVVYTSRPEDLTLAKVRMKRCEIAIDLFKETTGKLKPEPADQNALKHFTDSLETALNWMNKSVGYLDQKLNLKKSDYFEGYKLSLSNFMAGVDNWVFADFLRNLLSVNSDQFKYALRVSIGLCLAVFLFKFFQIDYGYWIALTMIIVIQPYYGATRRKGAERILGTLAGVILGGLIMLLPLSHQTFVVLLVIVSFFVAYFLRNNYKIGVFFVTVMMVILMQLTERGSLELIGWRVTSTLLGAILAVVSGYVFWPVWEKQRFPALMKEALLKTKHYLQQVVKHCHGELASNETWLTGRRHAETADNLVFASVQRMYEEPRHLQEQVDDCFAMVGAVIRINREITSIALAVDQHRNRKYLQALTVYGGQAEKVINELMHGVEDELTDKNVPDFQPLKQTLASSEFQGSEETRFLKTELEKIVFELEAIAKLLLNRKQLPENTL